jgi:hypothetical protein
VHLQRLLQQQSAVGLSGMPSDGIAWFWDGAVAVAVVVVGASTLTGTTLLELDSINKLISSFCDGTVEVVVAVDSVQMTGLSLIFPESP